MIPTLFLFGFSLICLKIISAPGKSAAALLLFPRKFKVHTIRKQPHSAALQLNVTICKQ